MTVHTAIRPFRAVPTAREQLEEFPGFELPMVSLGALFRADDSIAVSGSVDPKVAATAELTINGCSVPIAEWGAFCTVVSLEGKSGLRLSLKTKTHPLVTVDLPLQAI